MTTTPAADLCRITVFGPDRRVDLAVPVSISVSSLLPVLLRHTSEPATRNELGPSWVLQRLGGEPMGPTETPQTLNWNEGEQLYLRSTGRAFPEMDFDDVADGMATTITAQPGRWRSEYNQGLFLALSVALLLLIARILLDTDTEPISWMTAATVAGALVISSVIVAYNAGQDSMVILFGLAGCGFAAIAAAVGDGGVAGAVHLRPEPMMAGALAAGISAGVLILSKIAWVPEMPFVPFGVLLSVGGVGVLAEFLHLWTRWTPLQVAGSISATMLLVLVYSPRSVIRVAGLRVPQLPRNAEEMQQDIQPASASDVTARTIFAEQCLVMVTIATAVVLACTAPILVRGGSFAIALEIAITVTVLIRAGGYHGIWQRVSLAATGAWGVAQAVMSLVGVITPTEQAVMLVVLSGVLVALQKAMVRPPHRRLLPIWGQVANYFELLSAAVTLPLVLELFGVYVWARGLMN